MDDGNYFKSANFVLKKNGCISKIILIAYGDVILNHYQNSSSKYPLHLLSSKKTWHMLFNYILISKPWNLIMHCYIVLCISSICGFGEIILWSLTYEMRPRRLQHVRPHGWVWQKRLFGVCVWPNLRGASRLQPPCSLP